ncbi:MAG TPA: alpha-2-macroglobulin family protein, partial [Anaerolineales bacterium]|nr:alpha-2-macroglobulin family protein [Anaerolineales bacterium]
PNPFPGASQALLTVERGEVLRHELLSLPPGGLEVALPLLAEDAPNVYASVTLLGRGEGGIDFRFGLLNLDVAPAEFTLNVTLTSSPQQAGPGDEVTFEIQVTDQQGEPVEGEFSISVVDLAVLALADPNAPDILPAYYGQQSLGVRTSMALAAYPGRVLNMPGGLGGGGGDMVAEVVRDNFPDTAYWNASVVTGSDGRAVLSLRLPDSLTTWQIDLRGITQASQVGQAQAQVVATQDLLVRPVTPQFFVAGDHSLLAAIVQNNTPAELSVNVQLQATGLALDVTSASLQTVQVPANGRQRVEWWGTVQDVPELDLIFAAEAENGLNDAARPGLGALPVMHYTAPRTFSTAGVLDSAGERLELVSLPRSFDPAGSGSLRLEVSPSLAAGLIDALDYLEHYPYECTEQTLSRFLPNLETYRALQISGSSSPAALQAQLERTLNDGLTRLQATQSQDGGWSWWSGGASDPYVTAYVVFGLSRTRDAGIEINAASLQRASDYLLSTLLPLASLADTLPDAWQLDRQAFIHFALTQAGVQDLSGVRTLAGYAERLSPWANALLALTLEQLSPGDAVVEQILSSLQASALRSASGVHWELPAGGLQNMHTGLSNSAIVLYALAQLEPTSPLLSDSARYLMVARQAGKGWNATYTTAWSIMALSRYMQTTGELAAGYGFGASLNGVPLLSGQAGGTDNLTPILATVPLMDLYPDYPNALQINRTQGGGRLYYTADLSVSQPVEQVGELSQGLRLERKYYPAQSDCTIEACPPVGAGRAGEMVRVRLTLTLPQDAYYLLVEDYLPAGAEILNSSLKTSQQGVEPDPAIPLFGGRDLFTDGWGWWYFHNPQIYAERIAWAADYVPAGTYELTYTLVLLQPGEYRVLPARGWQFYFPDVQGSSPGALFRIEP